MSRRPYRLAIACVLIAGLCSSTALADSGGPDGGGYIWSDEPAYAWVEPEAPTYLTLDDDNGVWVDLPFAFPFYGQDYARVWVASNGFVSVNGDDITFVNQCPLPNANAPNGAIYALWDDLIPPGGGTVSYEILGEAPYRQFSLTYEDVAIFNASGDATFQIRLSETTGWVQVAYKEVEPSDLDAVAGIENPDGSAGLSVWCEPLTVEPETSLFMGPPGAANLRAETEPFRFRLRWDEPAGPAERYAVEARVGTGDWFSIGETDEDSIVDPHAVECTSRDYRVSALAGDVGAAPPVAATIPFSPVPPADLAAVAVDGERVELSWTDRSGCEDRQIVEADTGAGFETAASVPANATTAVLDGALPDGATYRVRAAYQDWIGDPSDAAPIVATLLAADALAAQATDDGAVRLTWQDRSTGEWGTRIERKEDGGDYALLANLGPDSSDYTDTEADPETAYTYRVRPYAYSSTAAWSDEAKAETGETDDDSDDEESSSGDDDDGNCCG